MGSRRLFWGYSQRRITSFTFEPPQIWSLISSSEALLYTLHERHPPSAGRMVSAFDVSATLKLKLRTSPFSDVPDDAYKLEAVPAPYGGVLILSSKSIVYYQSNKRCCELDWNGMIDFCTCIRPDLVLLSLKDGEMRLLRLVHDGCTVKRLDLTHYSRDQMHS